MIVRTEAFVLKAIRFGETSMIYRLFTRDRGIVPVIAKGARRPRSRFGAVVEPFHRLGVMYYDRRGREIQTLAAAELLAGHPGVARSLERMEAAGVWLRYLRAVVPDGFSAEPLYDLLAAALPRLEATSPARARRWETYHRAAAAALLGVAPRLEGCAICGRWLPDGEEIGFAPGEGGVVCRGCHAARPGIPLSRAEYALLRLYHQPEFALLEDLEDITMDEVKIQDLIHDFTRYHS
ncbi:MAG TPA: DNA repair protein RecO [Gemmatimonadota bacterium]|nr:DNA repair protein RecO [Gemmatimonadota bacterium]